MSFRKNYYRKGHSQGCVLAPSLHHKNRKILAVPVLGCPEAHVLETALPSVCRDELPRDISVHLPDCLEMYMYTYTFTL